MDTSILIGLALAVVTFFVFRALLGGGGKRISPEEARKLKKEGGVIVDVRSPGEFAAGKIKGARNIPLQELRQRYDEIPKDKPVILCCQSGSRSGMAARLLETKGYTEVYNLGSWRNY